MALRGTLPGAEAVPDIVASARRIFVLAVGKAAARMMAAAEQHLEGRIADAIAVVLPAPMLSRRGSDGGVRMSPECIRQAIRCPTLPRSRPRTLLLAMLENLNSDDLLIVLLSGGASAMMAAPAAPITLEDKIAVSAALLRVRASIGEINAVRKHLSAVKGGQLLRHCHGARVLSLILSDVRGNDLATIGSGLTAADHTNLKSPRRS